MQQFDYNLAVFTENGAVIPLTEDPCARVVWDATAHSVELQHAVCDVYIADGKEIEEWSWHPAFRQPDAEAQKNIMEELARYAANETILSRAMR